MRIFLKKIIKIVQIIYLSCLNLEERKLLALPTSQMKFIILKPPHRASRLVKSKVYNDEIANYLISENKLHSTIGHSRLVTNGYEQDNENNQPVAKNGIVGVHNGIIVNDSDLWSKYSEETKTSELDSELIPTLISLSLIHI